MFANAVPEIALKTDPEIAKNRVRAVPPKNPILMSMQSSLHSEESKE
jgi:hypothetical protein